MKKGYNISVDHEVMESFQKSLPDGKKSSHVIERMLKAYVNNQLVFTDETDGQLGTVRAEIDKLGKLVKELDYALGGDAEEEGEWG